MQFKLESKFKPTGDQPEAIKQLFDGINSNEKFQTLLGVTGSGKTFTVANVIEDRACRTKLAVEPEGDFETLFTQWDRFGWHRVTVYGDLKEPLFEIAKMLNWKVTEEA